MQKDDPEVEMKKIVTKVVVFSSYFCIIVLFD